MLRNIMRVAVRHFFRLLAILAIVLYVLAMWSIWPYTNASIPDKIHYTVWLIIILSLFDSADLQIIRNYFKRKKSSGPPKESRCATDVGR